MLIDTHCHLHDPEFFTKAQAEEILKRAHERGVKKVICIGTSAEDSLVARDFASTHKGVYWTYGIHPECASKINAVVKPVFSGLESSNSQTSGLKLPNPLSPKSSDHRKANPSRPVAIGEIGLDYHYGGYDKEAQIHLFEEMLQLASDNSLPVSFHVREAFEDFFGVISNFPATRGVVHSFSDNKKNLKRILSETDFYIGVNGLATYTTLPTPPLERILLETDAPFLTPKPFRGIINESGYIREIAEWLSDKLAIDFETVERETTKNAKRLFRFDDTGV